MLLEHIVCNRFDISCCHVGILSRKISYILSLCVYYDLYGYNGLTASPSPNAVRRAVCVCVCVDYKLI